MRCHWIPAQTAASADRNVQPSHSSRVADRMNPTRPGGLTDPTPLEEFARIAETWREASLCGCPVTSASAVGAPKLPDVPPGNPWRRLLRLLATWCDSSGSVSSRASASYPTTDEFRSCNSTSSRHDPSLEKSEVPNPRGCQALRQPMSIRQRFSMRQSRPPIAVRTPAGLTAVSESRLGSRLPR